MYSTSSAFTSKILSSDREILMKLVIGASTLGTEDVVSWEINNSMGNDGIYAIGAAISSMFEVTMFNSAVPADITTKTLKPYIGLDVSGTTEWVPLGVFYPDNSSIEKNEFVTTIKCYDKMASLGSAAYTTALTGFTSLRTIAVELYTNNSIVSENELYYDITTETFLIDWMKRVSSVREMLSMITQCNGSNCYFNREGKIRHKKVSLTKNISITPDNYISFKLDSDDKVNIDAIESHLTGTNEVYSYGPFTGHKLVINNTGISSTADVTYAYAAGGIFPHLYYAHTTECQGLPQVDCGDMIELTDRENAVYNLLVIQHRLVYNGGLKSVFVAAGPSQTEIQAGSTSGYFTMTDAIVDLKARVGVIEKDPTWTNVTFNSGYATISPCTYTRYHKDVLGYVHLEGRVSGTDGGAAFTLPVGYRPSQTIGGGAGTIAGSRFQIASTGVCSVWGTPFVTVSFYAG